MSNQFPTQEPEKQGRSPWEQGRVPGRATPEDEPEAGDDEPGSEVQACTPALVVCRSNDDAALAVLVKRLRDPRFRALIDKGPGEPLFQVLDEMAKGSSGERAFGCFTPISLRAADNASTCELVTDSA